MPRHRLFSGTRTVALFLAALFAVSTGVLLAQQAPPPPPPPDQTLTPDQLDDLVAPIALYPDPLLSQVLVAATYPLEVVQAFQWQQKNPGITGPALTEAAQQQNWDASVQALVIYPDVLKRLNDDVAWTTALGNAFLSQQQDVMDAVQRMRQKAQQNGKLQSTPQETVTTTADQGQPYIEIEPSSPDVIYVPVYDPTWIWGPPMWYPYPHWWWPPRSILTGGLWFGFGGPVNVGFYFGAGWHGWGGWGWHPGWGNHTVIVNNTFITRYNFNRSNVVSVRGNTVWSHDPIHRAGVPYAAPAVRDRFQSGVRQTIARPTPEQVRPQIPQGERFGNRQVPQNVAPPQNRGGFSGMENGAAARQNANRGYQSMGPARSAPAPRPAAGGGGGGRPSGGGGGGGGRPAGGGGGGGRRGK